MFWLFLTVSQVHQSVFVERIDFLDSKFFGEKQLPQKIFNVMQIILLNLTKMYYWRRNMTSSWTLTPWSHLIKFSNYHYYPVLMTPACLPRNAFQEAAWFWVTAPWGCRMAPGSQDLPGTWYLPVYQVTTYLLVLPQPGNLWQWMDTTHGWQTSVLSQYRLKN